MLVGGSVIGMARMGVLPVIPSWQVINVSEILRPTGCTLVDFQVLPADDRDGDSIDVIDNSLCIRLGKIQSRYGGQDFDPKRRSAHSCDLVGVEEEIRRYAGRAETECSKRRDHLLGVFRIHGDPDVHFGGGTRVSMVTHCIATDQ